MNGRDFVAETRLTNREGTVVAAVGETCENVDPESLPWLLEAGYVRRSGEEASAPEHVPASSQMEQKAAPEPVIDEDYTGIPPGDSEGPPDTPAEPESKE